MTAPLLLTAREEVAVHLARITDLAAAHRSAIAMHAARIAELEQALAHLADLADDYRDVLPLLPDRTPTDGLTARDLADLAALHDPDDAA